MKNLILVFVLILFMVCSFAQQSIYRLPPLNKTLSSFSFTDAVPSYLPYGTRSIICLSPEKTKEPFLLGNEFSAEALEANNFQIFMICFNSSKQWIISAEENSRSNFSTLNATASGLYRKPCPLSLYGIERSHSTTHMPSNQILLYNDNVEFKMSSLHKDEIIEDIRIQQKRKEWDMSGLVHGIYQSGMYFGGQ